MSPSIPSQMRAARVKDFNKGYTVEDVKVPADMGANDVLIQVKAAGYCHTDLQVMQGVYESQGAKPGLIGSHEPVGVIVKMGSEAEKNGKVKVGDRVGSINTYGYCGKCNSCRQGFQVCDNVTGLLGLTIDGGFAQYMKGDARVVSKIPESIPWPEAAPLFCAGATVYGALLRTKPQNPSHGKWIAIVGIGGLGHLAIQYAKALGWKVIAIDNRKEGCELAKQVPEKFKPEKVYLADSEEAQNKIVEELNNPKTLGQDSNPGVDAVNILAEGRELVKFTQQFTRKGGIVVDVGLPSDGPLVVDPYALNFKEQTVAGRLICTPPQCQDMINMHAKNGCKVHIEKTYGIEQMNDLFDHYQSKQLKGRVVMTFDD